MSSGDTVPIQGLFSGTFTVEDNEWPPCGIRIDAINPPMDVIMHDHRSCLIFNKCISGYPGPQDSSNNCYDLHFINGKELPTQPWPSIR